MQTLLCQAAGVAYSGAADSAWAENGRRLIGGYPVDDGNDRPEGDERGDGKSPTAGEIFLDVTMP